MGVIVNGRRVDGETLEAWPAQAVLPADVNAQDEKIFEPCIYLGGTVPRTRLTPLISWPPRLSAIG